jgi:hypothetical protein
LSDWLADAELAKKGRFCERNDNLPGCASRASHISVCSLDAKGEITDPRGSITKDVPVLRIDHISIKAKLPGVWQALYSRSVFEFREMKSALWPCFPRSFSTKDNEDMKNIKFVVKVNRGGTRATQYVQRVDPALQMTTNRKLALVMGRFTAEDAIQSLQNSRCIPELESVQVIT